MSLIKLSERDIQHILRAMANDATDNDDDIIKAYERIAKKLGYIL